MLCFSFHGGFQFLRLFDHRYDFVKFSRTGHFTDQNGQLAFFQNSSCIDSASFALMNRDGFTSHRGLVDHTVTSYNYTVERNHVAHADNDFIARFNLFRWNKNLLSITLQPYLLYVKRHAPRQICHRFLVGPFLQDLTDSQKEHHGRCSLHIATEHRYTDGCSIQYRNFQLAVCQCADSMPQIFYRFYCCYHRTDGIRQEHLASGS